MNLALENRSALVCGGSAGLGFGVAQALAQEGTRVCLLARDPAKLERAVAQIRQAGGDAQAVMADLNDIANLDAAIQQVRALIGDPDILVCNSAGPPPSPAAECNPQLWHAQLDAMLLSAMTLTNALLPAMRRRRFGRILMISSTSVIEPIAGLVLSSALRAALANWGKTLATELGATGITVNSLLPGMFYTERTQRLLHGAAERSGTPLEVLMAQEQAEIPLGRYGTAEEFGALAAFLASPLAGYLTGASIALDGGLLRS